MLSVTGNSVLVTAITAVVGSSALGAFVKWLLDRLNAENTAQHKVSLGTLQEVRDAVVAFKDASDEKFADISTTLRMGSTLAETLNDRVQRMSGRMDDAIEQWDESRARILERLDLIETRDKV
jgi:hypothetical protein